MSSLSGGLSSLAALGVIMIDDSIWWSDSTAGLVAALYTFYSGAVTTYSSRVSVQCRTFVEEAFLIPTISLLSNDF